MCTTGTETGGEAVPAGWWGTSRCHCCFPGCPSQGCLAVPTLRSSCSHDFIGEFATSYRELSRAQSQFTVYEVGWGSQGEGLGTPHPRANPALRQQVLNPRKKCKKKKYVNSGTVSGAVVLLGLLLVESWV